MECIIPTEINLLGYSGNILSLILETLKELKFEGALRVIKNIEVNDSVEYDPGLPHEILFLDDLDHFPDGKLLFGTAKPSVKKRLFNDFRDKTQIDWDRFFNLIHPHTTIASTVEMGNGSYIEPGVILSPFTHLGPGITINRGVTVGHHVRIDAFTSINPGVTISGHCSIGQEVSIGAGTVIFNNISIGEGTMIGGGSVVTRNIPPGVLAYGNPCKVIRELKY